MKEIREYLEARRDELLELLERLVNIDSGTYCKAGIDACGGIIGEALQELGFQVETIEETAWGNHVRAERTGRGDGRLLLSAHLDTVHPDGTAAKRPFRLDEGFAQGPGVGDMKGGIVQMLYALKALRDLSRPAPTLSVFLTGDEEVGSVRGRPHLEELARKSSWALVMEPSSMPGAVAVRRWGLGSFYLTVHGTAAHVLRPDAAGVNACRELALKILALESLSDTRRGVKVSVNVVRGGRSRQVTAATARAEIDVRVRDSAQMAEVEGQVRRVAGSPILPRIRIDLRGELTRPPLEPNPKTDGLLQLAVEVARDVGFDLNPIEEYGGSDGCLIAPLGVATLDGLGPLCHDMCGDEERIEVDSLIPRTMLIAGIMERLAGSMQ